MQGDLLRAQNANFGQCVSSDLAMSAGIAPQIVRFFPELQELRNVHKNLKTGSLIAHFSPKNGNGI